jgi:hypothetical protein
VKISCWIFDECFHLLQVVTKLIDCLFPQRRIPKDRRAWANNLSGNSGEMWSGSRLNSSMSHCARRMCSRTCQGV